MVESYSRAPVRVSQSDVDDAAQTQKRAPINPDASGPLPQFNVDALDAAADEGDADATLERRPASPVAAARIEVDDAAATLPRRRLSDASAEIVLAESDLTEASGAFGAVELSSDALVDASGGHAAVELSSDMLVDASGGHAAIELSSDVLTDASGAVPLVTIADASKRVGPYAAIAATPASQLALPAPTPPAPSAATKTPSEPPAAKKVDTLSPVMSTTEVRFFDAEKAVAALAEHEDDDFRDLDEDRVRAAPRQRVRLGWAVAACAVSLATGVIATALFSQGGRVEAGGSFALGAVAAAVESARTRVVEQWESDARTAEKQPATTSKTEAPPVRKVPTTGNVKTPRVAQGRRIFVDGTVQGVAPATVVVACGKHIIKVGSNGTPRTVDVPCGSDVMVLP